MVDKTIYKRDEKGKKLSKKSAETAKLRFKDRNIEISRTITIGRDKINDIVIVDDPLVSRKHALIDKTGIEYYLEDKKSTNGTYLNNNPIPSGKRVPIQKGDVIRIGKTKLKVV